MPELADTSLALMDINEQVLGLVTRLVERDIKAKNLPAKVTVTTDRRAAVEGADYVVNDGCITNLPHDCIVEVPGYVDRNGISIPKVRDLPMACAAICNASVSVQRLAVEAAVRGDVFLLKQAMMLDPLVGAVRNPPEISQMTDEMLIAQAMWLPQYEGEIERAKERFYSEQPLDTRTSRGAARVGS